MSYTPPAYNAANFTWVGVPAYTPPAHTAANFTWVPVVDAVTGMGEGIISISGAAAGVLAFVGQGAAAVPIMGEGGGYVGNVVSGVGVGVLSITGAAEGAFGASGLGSGSVPVIGGGVGQSGSSGAGMGIVPIAGSAVAVHHRYELRGEVRLGGVLVNRRVRAYSRASGALLSQGDTVAGKFSLHAGFAAAECYVTPIDLDPAAVDWLPPTANRILSVLADDTL